MLDIFNILDPGGPENWEPRDYNHDGVINGKDIPFEPGTLDAMKCWAKIDILAHSPAMVAKAKMIHPDAVGMYQGKALVPGSAGPDQGDFEFLRDRLTYQKGFSPEVATKIAAKVKWRLYSGGK